MRATASLPLLALIFAGAASAQSEQPAMPLPPAVKAPAINVNTLKTVTRTLSSDAYEGRAPTTPAETKTVAYIIDQMKRAGLKPGNKGSWTQDVPLVEITSSPDMALTVSGGKEPLSFAYKTDLVAGTYQVVPHSEIKDIRTGEQLPADPDRWEPDATDLRPSVSGPA